MADHGLKRGNVCGGQSHPRTKGADDVDPEVRVVTRKPLADVMQECAEDEEVGSLDRICLVCCIGGSLEQVSVDGESVVGVALVVVPDMVPLGQLADNESLVVERFERGDRSVADEQ